MIVLVPGTSYYLIWAVAFLAQAQISKHITLTLISINACWIAIDTDYNKADQLSDADALWVVAVNLFCLYYSFEWVVRFLSFESKPIA